MSAMTAREMTPAEQEQDEAQLATLILASRERVLQELAAEEAQAMTKAARSGAPEIAAEAA